MTSTLLLAALVLGGGSSAMPDCPLAVPAGTTLQGRVVSSAAMARGVTTLVLRRELPEAAETCEVPVDPVGGFVLDGLPAGVYSLRMAGREVGALFASPGGGAVELSVYLDRENRLLGCLDAPACAEWLRPVLRWPPAAGADVDPGIELLALRLGLDAEALAGGDGHRDAVVGASGGVLPEPAGSGDRGAPAGP